MHLVYVLKSLIVPKSYVGVTNDITRRLNEHNTGKNFYTKRHIPWAVVHTERFENFKEARAREKYLKSSAGRRALKEMFVKHSGIV